MNSAGERFGDSYIHLCFAGRLNEMTSEDKANPLSESGGEKAAQIEQMC